jgi:quercetin dioxygenase-like cupin family protein
MSENANVFTDDWDDPFPPTEGWHSHVKRLIPPGNDLGMSMWELLPKQTQVPYHFHHGADELILVLRGRPTLRTPEGERELEAGDVVHFPKGPAGAHQVINHTDEPVRYVLASSNASPEVVEYPDSRKVAVASRLESQLGERLWSVLRFEDVDYFEGEEPKSGA